MNNMKVAEALGKSRNTNVAITTCTRHRNATGN